MLYGSGISTYRCCQKEKSEQTDIYSHLDNLGISVALQKCRKQQSSSEWQTMPTSQHVGQHGPIAVLFSPMVAFSSLLNLFPITSVLAAEAVDWVEVKVSVESKLRALAVGHVCRPPQLQHFGCEGQGVT